ncbi:Glycolate dehydrogenase, FAD-binding subunit GlcE [uncultured Candidatus Thioglobus sp.]|nr:Glycolate dehydrogenase, FAD-binding subunit GlcE [uncultured Candidatus Thioglobus sp.]
MIKQLQQQIKDATAFKCQLSDYAGIVEYHPEELVMTVKAGTKIAEIKTQLANNNQALTFYAEDEKSIGAVYAIGGQNISDSVLGIQIIDGTGELLTFGGQVMKNVAGYDVARLLVGSKGKLALITQISFKVMPSIYVGELKKSIKSNNNSPIHQDIERRLKSVFDPRGIFE